MTNRIAIMLAGVIIVLFGLDTLANDGAASVFLGRKLVALIEWIAFWR